MTQDIGSKCPLCGSVCPSSFLDEAVSASLGSTWRYYHCQTCDLIHRDRASYLTVVEERERYAMHENSEQLSLNEGENGYLRFLKPVLLEIEKRMPGGCRGLDFGCGPGPLLAQQLLRSGYQMSFYDPQFASDESVLRQAYDFVSCTEVLEHLKAPDTVLFQLLRLVSPDVIDSQVLRLGTLFFMTGFHSFVPLSSINGPEHIMALANFRIWHYRRDPTHICFFSAKTFRYWAQKNQCEVFFPTRNVAVIIAANGTS